MSGYAAAQQSGNVLGPVQGSGTPGTVPLWTGSGSTLTNSHIQDNGSRIHVGLPLSANNNTGDAANIASNGTGVFGKGSKIGVTGQGNMGVQATGTTYGVHASATAGVGVYGAGTSGATAGVFGESSNPSEGIGVVGQNLSGGIGVRAVQRIPPGTTSVGNFGVESFSDSIGVSAWGPYIGVKGASDNAGVVGQIRDPAVPVTSPDPPITPLKQPYPVGVVGNCVKSSGLGCAGIYGYANVDSPNAFAHGVVGETDYGPDGAGVIGITHSTGQGVRGGTDNANGIGVVGYNTAGGKAGQFQGNVLITQNLEVDGTASKPGGGSWSALSDARLKKSIQPLIGVLGQLLQLRGVTYEYADPSKFGELPGEHIGMVAQDVEQVFPSWVDTGRDGYKRVTFRGFEAVTVEAVRELEQQVQTNANESTARIKGLEQQNAELRHEVEALSEMVKALRLQHK
jgi:hypothetical protein